ncbi:MAG TPA: thioesterase family protein [Propionibacteriaceae bacterium]
MSGPSTTSSAAPADETSYYRRIGPGRFRPSAHTEGAWQPGEQHMAPVSGIVVHAIEQFLSADPRLAELQLARITFEILGMIAADDFDVVVEVVRPGRTIALVEATLVVGGRPVIRARAWCLSRQDTSSVAGGMPDVMARPDATQAWAGTTVWSGGFISSVQVHPLPGGEPGRTRAWLRTEIDLVADEPASDLARFLGLVDTANGIGVRQPPTEWMFPNVDLSVHLYRQPRGSWVGLDSSVIFGSDGVGLTTTTLHDLDGPVGRAEQILTVRPLPGRDH